MECNTRQCSSELEQLKYVSLEFSQAVWRKNILFQGPRPSALSAKLICTLEEWGDPEYTVL